MEINPVVIETMPRHSLMRILRFASSLELYEAARREVYRRDTESLRGQWHAILMGYRQ